MKFNVGDRVDAKDFDGVLNGTPGTIVEAYPRVAGNSIYKVAWDDGYEHGGNMYYYYELEKI